MSKHTRGDFIGMCAERGEDPVEVENGILSIPLHMLPRSAADVREGGTPTDEYWDWLISQLCSQ